MTSMDQPTTPPGHLFVYGTLRSDASGAMHARLMRGVRRMGPASILGRLYDAGRYPAAIASDDAADHITGELYAIDATAADRLLTTLDAYEGIDNANPALSLFRRTIVAAEREGGMRVPAWVYLYNRPIDSLPRVTSGDWLRRVS
jgi:gamma-glutamylcyclotransferase (GGCT)/AIG2-like uncharacterized protein YtfP